MKKTIGEANLVSLSDTGSNVHWGKVRLQVEHDSIVSVDLQPKGRSDWKPFAQFVVIDNMLRYSLHNVHPKEENAITQIVKD